MVHMSKMNEMFWYTENSWCIHPKSRQKFQYTSRKLMKQLDTLLLDLDSGFSKQAENKWNIWYTPVKNLPRNQLSPHISSAHWGHCTHSIFHELTAVGAVTVVMICLKYVWQVTVVQHVLVHLVIQHILAHLKWTQLQLFEDLLPLLQSRSIKFFIQFLF